MVQQREKKKQDVDNNAFVGRAHMAQTSDTYLVWLQSELGCLISTSNLIF